MAVAAICLQILITTAAVILGAFIYVRPLTVIELQKQFYRLINWRIEPISMEKEIRNTKYMGIFLLIAIVIIWMWRLR